VEHGRQHRVVLDRGAGQAGEEALSEGAQGLGLGGPVQGGAEVVDDLVGVADEAVQGMDVALLPAGQQQGGQVVGAAVAGVQLPAPLIGRSERPRLDGRPRPQHEPASKVTTA
jgi:hypothetical protein